MRLTMSSQSGQIQMQTQNAKMYMKTDLPKIQVETNNAKLEMKSSKPQIQIDQSQCFAESGLKSIIELNNENAQNSVQLMYESIGRIADQGNQMAAIESKTNVIADQALYNAYDQFNREVGYGSMPKSRPKISVREGKLDVNYIKGSVTITPRLAKPDIQVEAGKVNISMKQYPKLDIKVEGSMIDLKG